MNMVCFTSESDIPNGLPKRIECKTKKHLKQNLKPIRKTDKKPTKHNNQNKNIVIRNSLIHFVHDIIFCYFSAHHKKH